MPENRCRLPPRIFHLPGMRRISPHLIQPRARALSIRSDPTPLGWRTEDRDTPRIFPAPLHSAMLRQPVALGNESASVESRGSRAELYLHIYPLGLLGLAPRLGNMGTGNRQTPQLRQAL